MMACADVNRPLEPVPTEWATDVIGRDVIAGLLRKHDRAGPRYTSYPPATEFRPLSVKTYVEEVSRRTNPHEPLSLYVHIPFCASPCFYCGCNKIVTRNRSAVREYLDHLRMEMDLVRSQMDVGSRPVTQLHWGGGTPTFLDDAEMTELMHHLASGFNLGHSLERDYAIEIDPRSVNPFRIGLLRGLGFNRVSLGIQDFAPAVQSAINREQAVGDIRILVEHIRASGFSSLNFDLIYGLPRQTEHSIRQTLEQVIALSPDRISYYNYAHLPDRFPGQRAIDAADLPTAAEKLSILCTIIETLTTAGYLYVGMDHFVRPGDSLAVAREQNRLCRNFQGYSLKLAEDTLGLGMSAISEMGGAFAQNATSLNDYYRALERGRLPIQRGLISSTEDHWRRDIIQQLTCYRLLDIKAWESRHRLAFNEVFAGISPQIDAFIEDGLLVWNGPVLKVTAAGCLVLRNICMLFDAYAAVAHGASTGKGGRQFSRVI